MLLNATAILTDLTRQEQLRLWMKRNDQHFKVWGLRMGISGGTVAAHCDAETMPVLRHRQLVDLGVPVELLPPPVDQKPGPKPRLQNEFLNAFRGV